MSIDRVTENMRAIVRILPSGVPPMELMILIGMGLLAFAGSV